VKALRNAQVPTQYRPIGACGVAQADRNEFYVHAIAGAAPANQSSRNIFDQ